VPLTIRWRGVYPLRGSEKGWERATRRPPKRPQYPQFCTAQPVDIYPTHPPKNTKRTDLEVFLSNETTPKKCPV